eukprot:7103029-Prymnesium_polylepis.1
MERNSALSYGLRRPVTTTPAAKPDATSVDADARASGGGAFDTGAALALSVANADMMHWVGVWALPSQRRRLLPCSRYEFTLQ